MYFISKAAAALCSAAGWGLLLAAPASLALAQPKSQAVPIRIAMMCPFTGGSADFGLSARNGVRLAVEEINAAGGLLGRNVELVEHDDGANPATAQKIVEAVGSDSGISALIGPCNTGLALAVLDKVQKLGLPLLVPVATGTAVTAGRGAGSFVFRVSARDDLQAAFVVGHALKMGAKRFAIFADATPYGAQGAADVRKALTQAGLQPVFEARFPIGVKSLRAEMEKARQAGADVIISWALGPESAVVARSRAEIGWPVRQFGSWVLSFANFIQGAGAAGEGALMAQTFVEQAGDARRNAFLLAYYRSFGNTPIPAPMAAAQAYDATFLLAAAIRQAGTAARAPLRDALENLRQPYYGVIATYDRPFTPNDHDAISSNMLALGAVRRGRIQYFNAADEERGFLRMTKPEAAK
jgi:branched-chain amino acid transport system substrate-binding protein